MRRKGTRSLLLRTAVTASVAAVAFVTVGMGAASASTDKGATLNTFKVWDGSNYVFSFGCPDTTTYGQVITVPGGKTQLDKFRFTWRNSDSTGSMVVRGEVYAWDGSKATGSSLFEKKRTIAFQDALFHTQTFQTNGIDVTPGAQYVLFATIDKDYESCSGYVLAWGLVGDDYPGGLFVYQNNSGDESQWTATPWTSFGGADLAFKAFLT